ncbi:MAG: butyrate kinase [Bifidobacteriaceae bacterium]|jgi:butyrate kinase|nr:butyrate kinase [Bifidobacteriaceae bacterium]
MRRVLTINCGSTSTKVALFEESQALAKTALDVPFKALAAMPKVLDQLNYRRRQVEEFLARAGIELASLDMIVARAGAIPHVPQGGAWSVNELMIATLRYAPAAQHASSLSCLIGVELAQRAAQAGRAGVPVIIYDPTAVDCVDPVAKVTGLPEVVNMPVFHLLNPRQVAMRHAAALGRRYEDLNLITAHLGGGISLAFHDHGRVADWVYDDEGPLSPQRAGAIPTRYLADLCYQSGRSHHEMRVYLASRSGLAAYFGTQDAREVEALIEQGDQRAELVYQAMALGVAKAIGALATVRAGRVDGIVLTGGLAHSRRLTRWIRERVEFLAPVAVIPGEFEAEALAEGGLRVLDGAEAVKEYTALPPGYASLEEILARPSFLA